MIHRKRDWESAQEPCRFALSLSQLGVRGAAGCWEVREGAGSRAALAAGVRCPKVFFGWLSLFFFFSFSFHVPGCGCFKAASFKGKYL